jgi:hypothetical protein
MTACRLSSRRTAGTIGFGENSMNEGVVKTLLQPYPGQAMAFWAVDRRVGNVRNDSPDLFAPLSAAQNRSGGQ